MVVGHDAADAVLATLPFRAELLVIPRSPGRPPSRPRAAAAAGVRAARRSTLPVAHAELRELLHLGGALDPLGHDRGVDLLGERDQPGGEGLPRALALDPVDQRPVELDELGLEPEDVTQAREARAGVVDREAHAELAQRVERLVQALVVLDPRVLGDLDDDAGAVVPAISAGTRRRASRARR